MPKFDEMYEQLPYKGSAVRPHYQRYDKWLATQPQEVMESRREEAEMIFRRVGITFAVYGAKDEDGSGTERLIPFDLVPRIIPSHEWDSMEKGLVQRVTALNRFIHDVYHDQDIIKAGIVPAEQILNNAQFRPEMMGVSVPNDVYSSISGIDIVRAPDAQGNGEYYVLEDNLRVPSGVSYMLENRKMMMRLFPELFAHNRIAPVAHYPICCSRRCAPAHRRPRPNRPWWCSRQACTTAPISSTPSWPSRWVWNWSKGRIYSSRTISSTCGPRWGRAASTSSTAA